MARPVEDSIVFLVLRRITNLVISTVRSSRGLLSVLLAGSIGYAHQGELTRDQREVFELLDAFDPLDTSRLPFVCVWTEPTLEIGFQPLQRTCRHGFLLGADGHEFRVRYLDLGTATLTASPTGTPEHRRTAFEPRELQAFAKELVTRRMPPVDPDQRPDRLVMPWRPTSDAMLALFLARACARLGMLHEVAELWRIVPSEVRSRAEAADGASLLASTLESRLLLDGADPTLRAQEVLARHDRFLAIFRSGEIAERIARRRQDLADVMADVQREDEVRSRSPLARGLARILRSEACVFQRADYGEVRMSVANAVGYPPGQSPLDVVMAQGLDAVPALIELLPDEAFTRSVVYSSRAGGHFEGVSLGALARTALVGIAGGEVPGREPASWRAFHDEARALGGIRPWLARRVAAPDWSGTAAAWTYLERWPEDPAPVFRALERAAEDPERALRLLRALCAAAGDRRDPRLVAALEAELGAAITSTRQVELARLLRGQGVRSGTRRVLESWLERMRWTEPADGGGPFAYESAEYLVRCADVAVWQAIEQALRGARARKVLAGVLQFVPWSDLFERAAPGPRPELADAIRRCLEALLQDSELVGQGATIVAGSRRVCMLDTTVADVAATLLTEHWPARGDFDPAEVGNARARRIAVLRGDAPAGPARSPDPRIDASIARIHAGAATWRDEVASLRRIGSPALPALLGLQRDQERPLAGAAREAVAALVEELANRVTQVASPPAPELGARLAALSGARLDVRDLLALLVAFAETESAKGTVARIHVERDGAGAGVRVALATRSPTEGEVEMGGFHLLAVAGGTKVAATGIAFVDRAVSLADLTGPHVHEDYVGLLEKCVRTPPTQGFEFRIELTRP